MALIRTDIFCIDVDRRHGVFCYSAHNTTTSSPRRRRSRQQL